MATDPKPPRSTPRVIEDHYPPHTHTPHARYVLLNIKYEMLVRRGARDIRGDGILRWIHAADELMREKGTGPCPARVYHEIIIFFFFFKHLQSTNYKE